ITALSPLVGVAGGAVLSSLVFGVLHAYQGTIGIVRTFLMGSVLATGFVLSGSLWPAIIAHTAIDLVAGLVLADWFLAQPGRPKRRAAADRAGDGSRSTGAAGPRVRHETLAETTDAHDE